MTRFKLFAGLLLLLTTSQDTWARAWNSSEAMADAARELLETLEPEQREAAHFPFDAVERGTWSNLPILAVPPSGVLLKDMNDDQRKATQALLRASLSSQGYAKFTGIMRLEDRLYELGAARLESIPEDERTPRQVALVATRDPNHYAVALFGEPGAPRWGWKLVGHHAAANFTVDEGRVAFTPTFLGSSPRVIETGPYAGMAVLPQEGDRGMELMASLTAAQQEKARVAEERGDGMMAGPGRQASLLEVEGLAAGELDGVQKKLLRVLVEEYVRNADFDAADAQLAAIEAAGWDALRFSWRGPVAPDGPFYYRIHGPRLLIEYDRVSENHDHAIVRDPVNDYGADWLGQHLQEYHPSPEEIRAGMQQRLGVAEPD
ncbi:MAG: DUF3500 domain-containing protein [Xanthomonadales bacterium]|jgi:hypothetical protein|nr:DUF3500 domain-containing protein [Xanthomonadales bacterium]